MPTLRSSFASHAIALALVALFVAALPTPAHAQSDVGWKFESELSGSLFFGNTRQTLFTTRSSAGHADSSFEFKSSARFTYGEATDDDDVKFVSKRAWFGSLNFDYRPFDLLSPFLLSTVETSLEKRINYRLNAGAGAKLAIVRQETRKLDVSLALLGERTTFPRAVTDTVQSLLRWSARFRAERELGERVRLKHETFYRPVADDFGRYTFTSSTSLAYRVARFASLNLSFLDNYDSEARSRGARDNNDGQLVVGILANF